MISIKGEVPLLTPKWIDYGTKGVKFKIRGLSNYEAADVKEQVRFVTEGGEPLAHLSPIGKKMCIEAGLLDWEGVLDGDEDDKPLAFDIALVPKFPDDAIQFLAYEIFLGSKLDEPAKKKSSSPPTSPSTRKSTTAQRVPKGTATKKKKRRSKNTK